MHPSGAQTRRIAREFERAQPNEPLLEEEGAEWSQRGEEHVEPQIVLVPLQQVRTVQVPLNHVGLVRVDFTEAAQGVGGGGAG